jgi:hypothetical protein
MTAATLVNRCVKKLPGVEFTRIDLDGSVCFKFAHNNYIALFSNNSDEVKVRRTNHSSALFAKEHDSFSLYVEGLLNNKVCDDAGNLLEANNGG